MSKDTLTWRSKAAAEADEEQKVRIAESRGGCEMSAAATIWRPSVAAGADTPDWFNAYSLHHDLLRYQVLEATSASSDDLHDASIELREKMLLEFERHPNDCQMYITRFEMLKSLHVRDSFSAFTGESILKKMRRCDVFFALALEENWAAHFLFSKQPLLMGLEDPITAVQAGLAAAISAANAYMFGLLLKAQISPLQRCGTVAGSHE